MYSSPTPKRGEGLRHRGISKEQLRSEFQDGARGTLYQVKQRHDVGNSSESDDDFKGEFDNQPPKLQKNLQEASGHSKHQSFPLPGVNTEGAQPHTHNTISPVIILQQNIVTINKTFLVKNLTINKTSPVKNLTINKTSPVKNLKQNIALIVLVGVVCCFLLIWGKATVNPRDLTTELREQFVNLSGKFPSQQRNLWSSFTSGIKKIIEEKPTAPSVFLLLHEDDRSTSECLAKEVGIAAAEFLNDGKEIPLVIDGLLLKNNYTFREDYGTFTDSYRSVMEKIGVMVVNNLQEIPGTIAQTFHTFCDYENPLVKRAAYIFTLKISQLASGKPTRIAEETLSSLWGSDLERDIMDPLIVRITSEVLLVQPEKGTPCAA